LVNGDQSVAKFNAPSAICGFYTSPETTLFVADTSNHCIRKLTISNERDDAYIAGSNVLVSVLTGLGVAGSTDGESGVAKLRLPQGVACANTAGATAMYVADTGNFCIRHVDMTNGNVSTVAGVCGASSAGFAEGRGTNAKFAGPLSAAFYKPGGSWTVFVADTGAAGGYRIRRATSALANSFNGFLVDTLAGTGTACPPAATSCTDGSGAGATFKGPFALQINAALTDLYVADGDILRFSDGRGQASSRS
jgi:hypothetical protein